MELNAVYAEIASLDGMLDAKRQELDDVRQEVFDNVDPSLPVVRTFLDGASRESKGQVLKAIYFMEKAYQYYVGDQELVHINDRTIELLRASAASVRSRVMDAKRGFGRPPSVFTRKPVVLDPYLTETAWKELRSSGVFTFALPQGIPEFLDWDLAMVRSVDFSLGGVSTLQRVIKTVHHGKSSIRNAGIWKHYSHQPVTALVETDAKGNVISDGTIAETRDDDYVGVAPFGPWTVGIRLGRAGDLKKISSVTVHFTGTGFPH
ncbi:hypothetical protein EOA32_17220 [Mesorhizobium sp. M1A.F.Ca.ET.072.01.1.1]|nr:hypothetical protein EOA32_17220 [Mesorhizobium sp. M1A.F.Ca.ET.072.01.1.1]